METTLPPKPQPPKDYDCCGGGCADCELKLYLQRLAAWQALAAERTPQTDLLETPPVTARG